LSSGKLPMEEIEVSLGRGIARVLSSNLIDEKAVPIEKIWNTLEDFGIKRKNSDTKQFTRKDIEKNDLAKLKLIISYV